jgi:hypothetical protein
MCLGQAVPSHSQVSLLMSHWPYLSAGASPNHVECSQLLPEVLGNVARKKKYSIFFFLVLLW